MSDKKYIDIPALQQNDQAQKIDEIAYFSPAFWKKALKGSRIEDHHDYIFRELARGVKKKGGAQVISDLQGFNWANPDALTSAITMLLNCENKPGKMAYFVCNSNPGFLKFKFDNMKLHKFITWVKFPEEALILEGKVDGLNFAKEPVMLPGGLYFSSYSLKIILDEYQLKNSCADLVKNYFKEKLPEIESNVIMDLRGIERLEYEECLGVLVYLKLALEKQGYCLFLIINDATVKKRFEVSTIDGVIELRDNLEGLM